jgi:hypothetical protein
LNQPPPKRPSVPLNETSYHIDHGDDKFLIFDDFEIENETGKGISFSLRKTSNRITLTLKLVTE